MESIDPFRWARLKDHLADLASMEQSDRVEFLDHFPLSDEDRRWLRRLAGPLLIDDQRLVGAHPGARAIVEREKLRWREGETIGRYRIAYLLGRGGMGEVYEARCIDTDQVVALKVLRAGLDQVDFAKFSENEQRALRRLDDPRIARFIEAFAVVDVGTCLVLEWIDGEPLQSYCRDRRYDVDSRLKLFIEVCQAVASAHQQLVIHLDLKPSNVLITPEGSIKLLDFGVAKLLDDEATQSHTRTHGDRFTLDYAAPEQVMREAVSTATDIYALGGVLFRLLTDASPYLQQDGGSLMNAVLNENPQRLAHAINRSLEDGGAPPKGRLDPDLDRVIRRAMEKKPKVRYRSVLELMGDIEAILSGRPIRRGGSARYRLGKFVRRNRATAAGAVVAIISVIALSAISIRETRLIALHAHRADVANHFLLTALDLTDRFSSNSMGDPSLSDVLVRAVSKARSELANVPDIQATVLVQLATALKHRGKNRLALSAMKDAYAIRKTSTDSTVVEMAEAAQNLASTEIELDQLDAATGHLREALEWLQAASHSEPVRIATFTSLGKLASKRGDAEESLRWYEEILPIRKSLPGDHRSEVAMDYNNLGTGLYNLGRYKESDSAYSRGVALLELQFGNVHPLLGVVRFGRAACLIQLGRFQEAASLLDQTEFALGHKDRDQSGQPGSISTERLRAQLDYYAGDYGSARHRIELALAQFRKSSPVNVAAALNFRSRIELAEGRPISAEATLVEAEQLYVENGRSGHVQRWVAHGLHGAALSKMGRVNEGDSELEAAIHEITLHRSTAISELAELTLLAGEAARRRGDLTTALRYHRQAEVEQKKSGWLGEFGVLQVNAELILDGMSSDADAESRKFARMNLDSTITTLRKLFPKHPLLKSLEDVSVL